MIRNITKDTTFDAVILADGDFPTNAIPLGILNKANYLVCCDGAGAKAIEHGIMPTAVVGDGDSLPKDMKSMFGDKFHYVSEQDYNDLTKATRYVLATIPTARRIAYIGATGKREDHTLGNISLLPFYKEEFDIIPTLITDHGSFSVACGKQKFESFYGQQVSIFNLSCSLLSGIGFRWQPYAYKMLWQGTLNEAVGNEVDIDGDGTYMVFRTYQRKINE